jgi:hypothetical protein
MPLFRPVCNRLAVSPGRTGPRRIGGLPRDDVDMELPDDIAECPDIELVAAGHRLQRVRHRRDLLHEESPVGNLEVDDLDLAHPPRHHDQPGEPRVVHQPHV